VAKLGVSLVLNGCAPTASNTHTVSKPAADTERAEVERFITSLSQGDASRAETRFSPRLRNDLPPPLLKSQWHGLLAHNGPFQRFAISGEDYRYSKRRFTVDLQFSLRSVPMLVVLEPTDGKIIGLFFPRAPSDCEKAEQARDAEPAPAGIRELELRVGDPPVALGASLSLPQAAGARMPALLFLAGSGPRDRDETVQRAKPFRDLAYGLARRGVVTLRFDKRTCAQPNLFDTRHGTVEQELIGDALAAVKLLRDRPEVDPTRIYILGHSLGGLVAPEVAERSGGIAGLVLLAAPGRPLPELMIEQLSARGAKPEQLAALKEQVRTLSGRPPDDLLLGVPIHYLRDLARRDEMAVAARLAAPVLYLRGELDQNVFAADAAAWTQALSGRIPFDAKTFPGLNHLFLPDQESLSGDVHVPEIVVSRIADFVLAPSER
jgi:dienelactone hydrolase